MNKPSLVKTIISNYVVVNASCQHFSWQDVAVESSEAEKKAEEESSFVHFQVHMPEAVVSNLDKMLNSVSLPAFVGGHYAFMLLTMTIEVSLRGWGTDKIIGWKG